MAEIITACMTHDRDISDQVKTWRIGRHDDHAGPKMGRRFPGWLLPSRWQGRAIGRTGIPLLSINHIFRTVFDSGRIHHDGIGARNFHLCHGEATPDLSVYKGLEIFISFVLPSRIRGEFRYFPGIRPLTAEDIMTQGATGPELPTPGRVPSGPVPFPRILRMVGGPELHLFHHPPLFGQFGNHRFEIFSSKNSGSSGISSSSYKFQTTCRYGRAVFSDMVKSIINLPLKLCKTGSPFAPAFRGSRRDSCLIPVTGK